MYLEFAGEYANQNKSESANFRQKPKNIMIPNKLSGHDRMGKKTISRYCPFNIL